jgi:hypothetical protein
MVAPWIPALNIPNADWFVNNRSDWAILGTFSLCVAVVVGRVGKFRLRNEGYPTSSLVTPGEDPGPSRIILAVVSFDVFSSFPLAAHPLRLLPSHCEAFIRRRNLSSSSLGLGAPQLAVGSTHTIRTAAHLVQTQVWGPDVRLVTPPPPTSLSASAPAPPPPNNTTLPPLTSCSA